ncbi:MAG: uroporphyrinogen-III synthase [Saprospiraceae bacterium]|jgi:uroporphyrinogen-III synthase|nr:uroporphyrinogen-III synthase [Candidatus Vicinibacter affinis]MBK7880294.1 uroporphyrinogen-III synthase [Candidatus Vicinibacter proximus]MBL7823343.1 uroporphyrinogen-III synthase [Saprospiraceae bacterium]MBK6574549.1 uroporphyrinogen-III synthase [Candidatus Vicinibacter affinis]MBK6823105.1 uroporphyrinogen-III synthase [Candidatus Vicinibacter affinis]
MPTKTTTIATTPADRLKKVKTILVSQPKPERSPYFEIENKYNVQVDWRSFIQVDGLTEKEFRKQRIRHDEFPCVIFTSKNAVDHFFRLAEESRVKISEMCKYFCTTETIANYLQKFIIFRKRKVFHGTKNISELATAFNKHKDAGTFLLPCSDTGSSEVSDFLKSTKIKFQEAVMYRTVSADLSDLKDIKYDILVFFSQLDIKSLFENFPDFEQGATRLAAFGNATAKAVLDAKLILDIQAPSPQTPSMTMALDEYLKKSNK